MAQRIKHGVRHIRLEPKRLRAIDKFQEFHHVLPAVHSAPADFSLRSKPFTVALGNGAGFAKSFRDSTRVVARIFNPCGRTRRGINAHHTVLSDAKLFKLLANGAGLPNLGEKTTALLL